MPDWIASQVQDLRPPAVARTLDQARRLEASGLPLTYLVRGEPDFATPAHICQAASDALQAGHTHYSPTQGIPGLRRAVSGRMQRDFGIDYDPQAEILITSGATQGIFLAIQAVTNPGDEIILCDPVYDPYPSVVRLAGGVPVIVPAGREGGRFTLALEAVQKALTRRTRAILINNPWNPTGGILEPAELSGLAELAENHDLVLIADEIYEHIVFDGRRHHHLAAAHPHARRRTITIQSFSKTYAMTGWRLGYNLAPAPLTKAMLRIAEQLSRSAATFIQHAGIAALEGPQDATREMVQAYQRRRNLVASGLAPLGSLLLYPPEATFFAFLDVRSYGMDSEAMANYLLQQGQVVTIPGSVYGAQGEGFIRLSFAYDEETLRRGIEALRRSLLNAQQRPHPGHTQQDGDHS